MSIRRDMKMKKSTMSVLTLVVFLCLVTAALASGGGEGSHADSGVLLKDFLYRCFNFAVTFGILAYFITKPIRKGLAGRREGIAQALAQAEFARKEAEAKFAEYDAKLAKASAEIEEIYAEIRREGELEREKILVNAREMAEKIKQEAEKTAANEVTKACSELRQETARMAVALAENLLKQNFTGEDNTRLVNEYMHKVGELN
jgi:F-type H+-transporting ATPase subunit b